MPEAKQDENLARVLGVQSAEVQQVQVLKETNPGWRQKQVALRMGYVMKPFTYIRVSRP